MNNRVKNDWPVISVVLPVRNEEKFIERTLRYLLDQEYPAERLEIIVVDGRSDDSTRKRVKKMIAEDDRIRLLDNPRKLSSAARNIGARAARGDIITFIDGHVYIPNNQLLKNTALLMCENGVSVLSRPQLLDTPDNSFFQKAVAVARNSILGHGLDSTIYLKEDRFVNPASSGASYRKEIFEKVGYFDEDFDAAEDVEFNHRLGKAGYKSFSSIRLAVHYYPRNSVGGLFKQMVRYGVGRFRLFRKHREAFASGAMILSLLFAGLFVLTVSTLLFPGLLSLLALCLGIYAAINIASSLIISIKGDIRQCLILPIIYFTIHFGLAYGIIKEAIVSAMKRR